MQILNLMEKKRERVNRETVNTIREALQHINRILGLPNPPQDARWINDFLQHKVLNRQTCTNS